jgi:sterol desaturase/sphingolipid hydroxylase (fatty acid hydroxylase superfamily)
MWLLDLICACSIFLGDWLHLFPKYTTGFVMRNAIVFAIPVFFLFIALEWWWMKRQNKSYYRLNDTINDLSCGISQQILRAFSKAFVVGAYVFVYTNWRMMSLSKGSVLTWLVAFFAVDLCYYWFHRCGHRINVVWATHVVHHQSEEYNLAVALRQGAFQPFFTTLFYLPMALLGFPPIVFLAMASVNTLYQFWIHTRLVGKLGWLESFLNTPSHHRVHHGKNPKYLDKNYAGVLIIWDRLFGTFQEEEEEPVYGVTERLDSWNPVWANVHTLSVLARRAWDAERWRDKWLLWWMPPEWKTQGEAPSLPHPELDPARYTKYNPVVALGLKVYLVMHFLLALLVTLVLLHYQHQLGVWQLALLAVFVFVSLLTIGGLFDRTPWAWWAEQMRLLLLTFAAASLLWQGNATGVLSLVGGAGVVSLFLGLCVGWWLWLLRYRPVSP